MARGQRTAAILGGLALAGIAYLIYRVVTAPRGRLALRFIDGDDYIYVPPSESLVSTDAVTVGLRVRFAGWSSALLRKYYETYWIEVQYRKGYVVKDWTGISWNVMTTEKWFCAMRDFDIKEGPWHYICAIYDRSKYVSGEIYVDGEESRYGSSFLRHGQIADSSSPLIIGSFDKFFGFKNMIFNGYLTHVHLYPNKALAVEEIKKNAISPDDPVREGLRLFYSVRPDTIRDIDWDGVLEILDLSGHNNHGKVHGARPAWV